MVGNPPAAHHVTYDFRAVRRTDAQFQCPIGQQHPIARLDIGCQLGIAAGCPFGRPDNLLAGEHELSAVFEDAPAILKTPQADLRPLQVEEDCRLRILFPAACRTR